MNSSAQMNSSGEPNSKVRSEKNKNDKMKDEHEPGKSKAKEDKSIEHILKALNSLQTTEEKLAALCKKYTDLVEEHRTVQMTLKHTERKLVQLEKEKEQLQGDHSKAILTRSRLESLCRELQRQNREVKEESLKRVREEEEKRKEVAAKFQTTFNEITGMMQDTNQKSTKLREENAEMAQKLKTIIEQYELREQQVDKIVKHKELELQLADAKQAKINMQFTEEKEKFLLEKHKCLQDLTEYQKKCQELTTNEIRLRTQLNMYTDKYEEFQHTLSKSNQVFTHFKDEMDKMSKKIKKLEKETSSWRSRWENSNKALLDMAADKQRRDADLLASQKKVLQLDKLCRALQTERQTLLVQLKGSNDTYIPPRPLNDICTESCCGIPVPLDNINVVNAQMDVPHVTCGGTSASIVETDTGEVDITSDQSIHQLEPVTTSSEAGETANGNPEGTKVSDVNDTVPEAVASVPANSEGTNESTALVPEVVTVTSTACPNALSPDNPTHDPSSDLPDTGPPKAIPLKSKERNKKKNKSKQ